MTPHSDLPFGDDSVLGSDEIDASERAGVLGVAELTRRVAARLADLGPLLVEGELGPPKRAASGHVYFDLKEGGAVLSCVVWRSSVATAVPKGLEAGERVRVHGRLDVYAPRGSYSFVVRRIERSGAGELLARLERLKRELAERGWFDRRRALPRLPECIGVVTSRDGAAFRDFLRTRTLRWPGYPVRLRHTPVQGPGAAASVAEAIRDLASSGVDVVVVTRGGGSLEDLWCFNEEEVARAIFECPVPVVSAVGHETDTTLADLVADHRAHTPTDAAVATIPDRSALVERLERGFAHLGRAIERAARDREEALRRAARAGVFARPERLLQRPAERLERAFVRLERGGRNALDAAASDLARARDPRGVFARRAREAPIGTRRGAVRPHLARRPRTGGDGGAARRRGGGHALGGLAAARPRAGILRHGVAGPCGPRRRRAGSGRYARDAGRARDDRVPGGPCRDRACPRRPRPLTRPRRAPGWPS
ncbi:MAG: exodeoxyribonuclease VII large subunit [Planctomycetota bacterium]